MSWIMECKRKAKKLPVEVRKKFMEEIWKGKTIGEAQKATGITFDEANGIIRLNLKKKNFYYLNKPEEVQ